MGNPVSPHGRAIFRSSQVIIYDDFLSRSERNAVLAHFNNDDYRIVHAQKWQKVWRLADGFPMHGTTSIYRPQAIATPKTPNVDASALDKFAARVIEVLQEVESVVGSQSDWIDFTVAPWIYPVGSGLSLHKDGAPNLTGSYTYFLHDKWNLHWGGQLLILRRSRSGEDEPLTQQHDNAWISDESENERVWDPALALCVFPKPNRMVFISANAHHLVTRVDKAAGQNARLSIAGFFRKSQPSDGAYGR